MHAEEGGRFDQQQARLLEQAADELARLDATFLLAPPSFALAAQIEATAPRVEGTPSTAALLVAALADPLHADALPADAAAYSEFLREEERRVRGGTTLTADRFRDAGLEIRGMAALDKELRPGGQVRSVLLRAVAAAAAVGSHVSGSAVAALLLCAAGVTDRLRLLPFAALDPATAKHALDAWYDGDPADWTNTALSEVARAARSRRLDLVDALNTMPDEDARLDALGRAAITARRALQILRDDLAVSVPSLAGALGSSRPAASDALDRLVAAEIAVEITGRARDRVFALGAALTVVQIAPRNAA